MRISSRALLVSCVFIFSAFADAQSDASQLNLMPLPASYQLGSGQLLVDPSFSVVLAGHKEARLEVAVQRFLHTLSRQTGMALPSGPGVPETATLTIQTQRASKGVQELGEDESYTLEVAASGAHLSAPNPLGILHGLQTFLHLVQANSSAFAVPAISIQDKPRFPWRGLMIDVSRHFIPLDVLKRNLDGMEAVQLNVFHWHLSDNQGFRVESKRFPKLQELGSDNLYYTQEEVRDLVAYARERGIRVVPEFDIPGHCTAWFVGYPELASGPGPYQIERNWGVFDPAIDPTQERAYKVLDELFGEMAKLFPDQYFHIGGDEVNGKQWKANPEIQKFMKAHGIQNNAELQAHFNKRVQEIVSHHGKTMMGWDEILSPDLPKSIVIQSWRGQQSLADASRQGYRGLLSSGYYIDLMQPASQHYAVDPMAGEAASLNDEQTQNILGGEATMWTEYVSPENIDSRIWPRTAAIAERFWSPQSVTDVDSMYRRLAVISEQMSWLGLTHNSSYGLMLGRLAGSTDSAALHVLADVLEPVKGYTREELAPAPASSVTPLNRLVDAVRPESAAARRFTNLVEAVLSAPSSNPAALAGLRAWLTCWRDNDAKLQPLIQRSFLLHEDEPLSVSLSQLGTAGLRALDNLERGQRAPDSWKSSQLAAIEEAKKPRAQLLLMVVPAVQRLVEASFGVPSEVPLK
jgi:hexosaminidase